jgi:type I restriction enzyme, R subunit
MNVVREKVKSKSKSRKIHLEGSQATEDGKREVRKALPNTLVKYKLHTDIELFVKAYGYAQGYYLESK